MSRKPLVAIALGAGLAVLVSVWLIFAPTALGGSIQFVTTSGASMQPAFNDGDLALLRKRDSYDSGDVVAFEHPELGTVLHRVVRTEGQRLVVKGDNNPIEDSYMPHSDDVIGAVWLRVPEVGALLNAVASRWALVLVATALGLFTLVPLGIVFPARTQGSGRRWRWHSLPDLHIEPNRVAFLLGGIGQALIVLLAFCTIAGLTLAFVSYNRQLDTRNVVPVEYYQNTDLGYSAPASGTVYSDGLVTTGDPIYRELVDELTFAVNYEVDSELDVSGDGTYWISAIVEGADGWRRTVPLREESQYAGTEVTGNALLPLARIDQAIDDFYAQTGLVESAPSAFTLVIESGVRFDGNIGEEVVHTLSEDSVAFTWDAVVLYPIESDAPDGGDVGTVDVAEETANTISLGAATVSVGTARYISQALLFIAVLGGVALWLLMRKALQASEIVQIAARYRSRIVPIQGAKSPTPSRVVALLSFDDLMRIADQKQEPILYLIHNDNHYYYVHSADVIYRVRIEDDTGQHRLMPPTDA